MGSLVLTMRHFTSFLPLLVAFLTWEYSKAEIVGTINVEPIGSIYVWKQFGNVVMEGNGVRMTADSRVYLLSKEVSTLSPDAFWQVNLDDQHFTYDLNLSVSHVTAMLPGTSSKCQLLMQEVEEITTAMPTMSEDKDVQNMIHWSQTSTLSLELFIIVDGMAAGTVAVMEVAVEVTLGIPAPLSVREDAQSIVTRSSGSLTIRTRACPTPTWSRMDRESALTFVVMAATSTTWVSITMGWCSLCHFGVDLA